MKNINDFAKAWGISAPVARQRLNGVKLVKGKRVRGKPLAKPVQKIGNANFYSDADFERVTKKPAGTNNYLKQNAVKKKIKAEEEISYPQSNLSYRISTFNGYMWTVKYMGLTMDSCSEKIKGLLSEGVDFVVRAY